jgi:organic radical activating enzyme
MPNQFCRYLSNGYSFRLQKGQVNAGPCCFFKNPVVLDPQLMQNRSQRFESIQDWTSDCWRCKILEDAGQQSLRQTGPDWIDDLEQSQDPVAMDINLDMACNAACVICDQDKSSLWAKENAKLNNKKITIKQDTGKIDQAIDQIVGTVSLHKLKYVKFFGGEPLFTDTHLKFIKHIPCPEQVILHYTTNGSIYPSDEVLTAWKKFKVVIFAASLDGIEQQFDYVRWPLPWSKVSKNLIRLKQNQDIWNVIFRVEFTANALNTWYYDRLETWVRQYLDTNLSGDKTEINIHHCRELSWGLEQMPGFVRELVIQKYPSDHVIHRLVTNLPKPVSLLPWKNFTDTWDTRRNNSWQTAFPDLARAFDCIKSKNQ